LGRTSTSQQLLAELDNDVSMDILKSSLQKFSNDPRRRINSRLDLTKMAAWRFTSEDKPQDHLYLLILLETKDATMLHIGFLKYMMLFPHYEKLMKEITLQENN